MVEGPLARLTFNGVTDTPHYAGAVGVVLAGRPMSDENIDRAVDAHLSIKDTLEWRGEIDAHLDSADVVLLLVSANFVASDYAWDVETQRAVCYAPSQAARARATRHKVCAASSRGKATSPT